jgi:hypothetical protein
MEMKKTTKKWTVPESKKFTGFVMNRLPKASRVHAVLWLGGGLLELRSSWSGLVRFSATNMADDVCCVTLGLVISGEMACQEPISVRRA